MNPANFLSAIDQFLHSSHLSEFEDYESQLSRWSNVYWVLDHSLDSLKLNFNEFYVFGRDQFVKLLDKTRDYAISKGYGHESVHFYCLLSLKDFYKNLVDFLINFLSQKMFASQTISKDLVFPDYVEFFNEMYDPSLICFFLPYLPLDYYFFCPRDYFVYTCLNWLTEQNLFQFYNDFPFFFFESPSFDIETLPPNN